MPNICGGSINLTYNVTDKCYAGGSDSATFTITPAPSVVVSDVQNASISACASEADINAAYAAWLGSFGVSGGCNPQGGFTTPTTMPNICGGSINLTYNVTDKCYAGGSDSATFTITPAPAVVVSDVQNASISACASEADINAAYAAWLGSFGVSGGCNPQGGFTTPTTMPNICGGSISLTYNVSDRCYAGGSDSATFTITPAPAVVVSDVQNASISACASEADINAAYAAWLGSFGVSGGCNPQGGFTTPTTMPNICGGSINLTYNVTDKCYAGGSDSATFTITPAPAVVVSDVQNASISACASEADINAAYAAWLGSFGVSGGCNPQGGFTTPTTIPNICGGSINLTYNVTDKCYAGGSDSATFTITAPEALIVNCPSSIELTCSQNPQIEFNLWIASFSFSGGCNPTATDLSGLQAPLAGQTLSITYEVVDKCETKSCTATFKVPDCVEPHCTYTQGYYGDYNGSACDVDGHSTTDYQIMVNAINQAGGTYNFGSTITGNYFTLKASDVYGNATIAANNVFTMLPGGGTPRALVGFATFDTYSTWSDNNPLTGSGSNYGKINNNLLSQTMTMFFNLSVDNTLGNFVLEPKFATSDVSCGGEEPISNTYKEFTINTNVIAYLDANYAGGATVSNLFLLANRALGGQNIGNLNHSMINSAVDAINNAFDGCRIQVPLVIIIIKPTADIYDSYKSNEPIFTVYPVPFKDVFTVKYDFDYSSEVKIQIFDTKGTLLQYENDTNSYLNKEVSIRPKFNRGEGQMFFVKVITDKGVSIKKVISEK